MKRLRDDATWDRGGLDDQASSLLRATLESTADGLLVVDLKGRISAFNHKFVEMWRIPDEVMARHDDDAAIISVLDQLADPAAFVARVEELYASPDATSFDVLHFNDGRVFERYSQPQLVDGEVAGRVWSFRDVTDRVRAEETLREREGLLLQSEQLANIGSWSWDIGTDVVTWSDQLYRIFGVSPDEFAGTYGGFLERVLPEDRDHVERSISSGFTVGRFAFECRIRRVDGTIRVLDCSGETVFDRDATALRMFGIARDVTEARAQERALRESEATFRRAFEDSAIGMALIGLDGRFLRVNEQLSSITGWDEDELLTMTFDQVTHPEDRAEGLDVLQRMLRGEFQRRQTEKRYIRPDGETVWVQITSSLIRQPDGTPLYVVSQVHDITQRKRAEVERLALEDQIRQAQKMEAVGRLAGGVAHDFNNLLTAILGNCDLLLTDPALPPGFREEIKEIQEAAGFGESVAAQLLELSRRGVVATDIVDLRDVIDRMKAVLQRLLGEGIELSLDLPPTELLVLGDAGALEQVVLNLAVNARDAMPAGGNFTIEATVVDIPLGDALENVGLRPGPHVVLRAADTGIGMEASVRERIFEPFFTTKSGDVGTGLGLSTLYQIVSQAGGHVAVESAPDAGATFHIFLPLVERDASTPGTRAPENGSYQRHSARILLAEDDSRVRGVARRALSSVGYDVLEAENGADALAQAENTDGDISILVTDVVMPSMDGPALARSIRAVHPETAVLYTSGYTGQAALDRDEDGRSDFLAKPFRPQELIDAVERLLARVGARS